MTTNYIEVPALAVRQSSSRVLYSFAIDGKQLHSIASVSRIRRGDLGQIAGYQRTEVLSHIADIRAYVDSDDPMIPNALVVAFDRSVRFREASDRASPDDCVTPGVLVIPCPSEDSQVGKPGWIVDGQQRAAAIRDADRERFHICVTAFIADDPREQREQFILVNSTKPLPKGLIYELLPSTEGQLPSLLRRRRFPAMLVQRLNTEADSPFQGMVATPTTPDGLVKDNSLIRMTENSLSDGMLYRLRSNCDDPDDAVASMLAGLKRYWTAVSNVFPDAWALPPRRSRLMHGAGIVALGFIMDAIASRRHGSDAPSVEEFARDLSGLREFCCWTSGYWDFGGGMRRKWNELQNTRKDVTLLANYLLHQYQSVVWR